MDEVLGQYKRIQRITLVYRILVISLQFIECYNVPDGEEDKRGGEQQRQHVAEGRECERHGRGGEGGEGGAPSSARASGERQAAHGPLGKTIHFPRPAGSATATTARRRLCRRRRRGARPHRAPAQSRTCARAPSWPERD